MTAIKGLFSIALVLLGAPFALAQAATNTQQQIELHSQKAQTYLQQKRPDLAIPELETVVQLDPKNVEAQANLGVLLFFRGEYAKATSALRVAVEEQPSLPKIQAVLGMAEKRSGDTADAAKDLEASFPLLQEQKIKTQVGMELIELYTASSDLEKAAVIVGKLRQQEPENKEVIYAAYRIYSDLASEAMLTLSLVAPDSAQMHQVMAHEEAKQGNTTAAITNYRKAIAIDPKLPGVHFELAEMFYTSDDPKLKAQAEAEYQAALLQNPTDVKAECRLAEIANAKGDLDQAKTRYSAALRLQPDDAGANFGLAKILIAQGQQAKALPVLERAVQLEPTDAAAHFRLSTLYRQQGRIDDSKREVEQYKKYKEMKEKLQALYKEMQIHQGGPPPDEKDER